jgi:hypothetical protein
MADRRSSSDKPDLAPDAVAPAPGDEPPDTVAIYGILGKGPDASNVRLYLDVGFTTYYDIPIEGIVEREKVPADRSPLGVDSSLLFVRKGIELVVHRAQARSVEEEFLAGDFTAPGTFSPIAAGGAGAGPVAAGLPNTAATVCTQLGCPTHQPPCGTHTLAFVCTELCHPSVAIVCTVDIRCRPSLGIACTIQGCHTQFADCAHTLATVCTLHCPPPISHQICPTLWTQIHCPLSAPPCPTAQLCGGGGGPGNDPLG